MSESRAVRSSFSTTTAAAVSSKVGCVAGGWVTKGDVTPELHLWKSLNLDTLATAAHLTTPDDTCSLLLLLRLSLMLPKVAVITTSMKVRTGHQVGAATGGRHHDAREGRVGTRAGGYLPSSYYQGGLAHEFDD